MRRALLALCCLLALPAPAAAAIAPTGELPLRGPAIQQSKPDEVKAVAQLDRHFADVLDYRPGLVVVPRFNARRGAWTVAAREAGSSRDLAWLVVDDRTRRVTDRHFVPYDQFPPRLTQREVRSIVKGNAEARRAIREHGGFGALRSDMQYVDGVRWEVRYRKRTGSDDALVQVDVRDAGGRVEGVWTGHAIAWEMARGNRRAFGGDINEWYVWWPFFAAFALVMLDFRRLLSVRTLDVAALLSFGVSHEFFNRGMLEWSVPLAVPPLLYLFARMAWVFWRGAARAPVHGRGLLPTWLVVVVAVFALGARYGVSGYGGTVIDVGYAGVAGASQVIEGRTPYGNMPADNRNGDTYAPLNYLVYVPAVAAFGGPDEQDWGEGLPAAVAVTIATDVLCVLALALVGLRWLSRRAAALLVAGWATYPYTTFAVANGVNDLLVAALLLLGFAALPRAWLRGGLVGAAAAVKFVPLAVLPIVLHAGTRGRLRQALLVMAGSLVVGVGCLGFIVSYEDGLRRFLDATWAFQYDRTSPFSPWGYYGWRVAQQVAQAALGLGLLVACVWPRARDFRQVAAGMAAALIGVQLVLQHWFYLYIPWFAGFVLVVLVAQQELLAGPLAQRAREGRSYTRGHEDPPGRIDPGSRLVAHGRGAR